jgi:hypothetical protein
MTVMSRCSLLIHVIPKTLLQLKLKTSLLLFLIIRKVNVMKKFDCPNYNRHKRKLVFGKPDKILCTICDGKGEVSPYISDILPNDVYLMLKNKYKTAYQLEKACLTEILHQEHLLPKLKVVLNQQLKVYRHEA